MSILARRPGLLGWQPNADAASGPPGGALRMDNTVLDEEGVLALRPGSAKINSVAFADLDVHSLFTGVLSGTRYRMAGAGNAVYANGTSIAAGLAGSGDVAFGSHLGQILFARSTTTKKYDGTTVRNWGISMTGGAPTTAAVTADTKVFMSCDTGETGTFTAEEGTIGVFTTGVDGTVNGARELTPNATSGRVSITKTFAADQDFSVYPSAALATDDDVIAWYVYLTDPAQLKQITLTFDVANATNRFQEDFYVHVWRAREDPPDYVALAKGMWRRTPDSVTVGTAIPRVEATLRSGSNPSPIVKFSPIAGWNKLSLTRGQFSRIGATSGKSWATVRAVRVVAEMGGGGTDSVLRIDDIRINGGPLLGAYKWVYVYVRNDGTYTAKSAPSALSAEATVTAQAADVTAPADGSRDSQINEIWVYRAGGFLDAFYRVKVTTGVSGTGAVTMRDALSDRDALIVNLKLEYDNTPPPSTILDIEGPYYDRTFCLTATHLYPSRRLNPDSYSTGQVIRVSGVDETAYWVKKAFGGLYIGTSKDIYRLSGTGAEYPDETIDFTLEPVNIDHPPISTAVTQDGNVLVYLADDGWRVMAGAGSASITGPTSLLYRGYTRHGVSPVNIVGGRFRAAIANGQLVAITPEGTSTTSSAVLYRHVFTRDWWYRHTYPQAWRAVHREPDGTLIASDAAGFVWALDTGTADGATAIPVVVWTPVDADGTPFHQKEASNLQVEALTGGNALAVALHLDGSDGAARTVTVTDTNLAVSVTDLTDLALFRQLQLRMTGSLAAFRFAGYQMPYQRLPLGVKAWDSGPMDLGVQEIVWLQEVSIKVRAPAALTVTPYFDGVAFAPSTLSVTGTVNREIVLSVPIGRAFKGKVPRLVITSASAFALYWVECRRRPTGTQRQQRPIRIPVGGEVAA